MRKIKKEREVMLKDYFHVEFISTR